MAPRTMKLSSLSRAQIALLFASVPVMLSRLSSGWYIARREPPSLGVAAGLIALLWVVGLRATQSLPVSRETKRLVRASWHAIGAMLCATVICWHLSIFWPTMYWPSIILPKLALASLFVGAFFVAGEVPRDAVGPIHFVYIAGLYILVLWQLVTKAR